MSRTYRRKGKKPHREAWSHTRGRGPERFLDKDLQRLPERATRSDGQSLRPDYETNTGGVRRSRIRRLIDHNAVEEGLEEALEPRDKAPGDD